MKKLEDLSFVEVQHEYWERIIKQFVEKYEPEEQAILNKILGKTAIDKVIDCILNDDRVWEEIDTSLGYYLSETLDDCYTIDIYDFEGEYVDSFKTRAEQDIVSRLFAEADTHGKKCDITIRVDDYDEDNILHTIKGLKSLNEDENQRYADSLVYKIRKEN